jgi:N-acyl homoserine lactone hydrolase
MNAPASITITPVRVADLLAEGERMPVYVHVIDHPDARVLVDTGITELHPAAADLDPRLRPLSKQDFDIAGDPPNPFALPLRHRYWRPSRRSESRR